MAESGDGKNMSDDIFFTWDGSYATDSYEDDQYLTFDSGTETISWEYANVEIGGKLIIVETE